VSQAVIDANELEAILHRPLTPTGSGRAALGELDARLAGLTVRVDAFRVIDGSGAVVTLGLVTPEQVLAIAPGTTVRDLWRLANAALSERGVPSEHLIGLGDDAFQALHGSCTAQVAWLAGERLATVSITSLGDDPRLSLDRARAIARRLQDRPAPGEHHVPLSQDDELVGSLLAIGGTNLQIARALGISERAAEWCISRLLTNLGLSTRAQLARWAAQRQQHATGVA
jgi:hypothetical protein